MSVPHKLPRQARLSRAKDFEAILRLGRRVHVFPLRVRALRRQQEQGTGGEPAPCGAPMQSRLGLAVGRRVGRANVRNRWKRAIREAFRLHRHRLAVPYDLVVGVAWNSEERDLARTEQALLEVMAALTEQTADTPQRSALSTQHPVGRAQKTRRPPEARSGRADGGTNPFAAAARVAFSAPGLCALALGRAAGWMIVALVRGYQFLISPMLPPACRFEPSCSHYMIEAVRKRGPVIGVLKGLWRLLRCNPLCRGGYDPVERADAAARGAQGGAWSAEVPPASRRPRRT